LELSGIVLGILFFIIGSSAAIFGGRFFKWFAGYKFENNLNLMSPNNNKETSTMSKEEYLKRSFEGWRFRRIIGLIFITIFRIMGAMLAMTGMAFALALIFNW
jgi:hypothetical protein